jgi:glutathione S-transferase
MSSSVQTPIDFYVCDFCPFAQRTWIALLEKESDPHHPKNFNRIFVNYFNKDLAATKAWMTATGVTTVPSGNHNGLQLSESLLFNEYINELFPNNPLLPESAGDKFRSRFLVEKYGSKLIGPTYKFLKETDKSLWPALSSETLAILADLSAELGKSSGPFFFGAQFTLADIAFFPFVERALVLLGHYRNFTLPETVDFSALRRWYDAALQRPSVQITVAERTKDSLEVLPYEAKPRKEYLIEVYESYAWNVINEGKKQLLNAPAGKKTFHLETALKEKNDSASKL